MKRFVTLALGMLLAPVAAAAQSVDWDQKGYVSFYVGGQAKTDSVDSGSTFELYDEQASVDFRHEFGGGFAFLVGGGARVWRNLVIGGALTRVSSDQTVTGNGQIPHPLIYNRPRAAAVDASGFKHSETAFHVHAKWMLPVNDRFDAGVFGGPSFVSISHDFATTPVTVGESGPPYSSVALSEPRRLAKSASVIGFHVGADATYRLTPQFGVGGFFLYSAAEADMDVEGSAYKVGGGGVMFGGGVRVSF